MENIQVWFISYGASGLDGEPLLLPVENNCPDEPPEIPEPWRRQTERTIGNLIHRLEQLESEVYNRY